MKFFFTITHSVLEQLEVYRKTEQKVTQFPYISHTYTELSLF